MEIHEGLTAEDISGKTAAAEAERELEADPELLDADAEEGGVADADAAGADADGEDAGDADAGEADGDPELYDQIWVRKTRMGKHRAPFTSHRRFACGGGYHLICVVSAGLCPRGCL